VLVRLFTDANGGNNAVSVNCTGTEKAVGGGGATVGSGDMEETLPLTGGVPSTAGQTPNGWRVEYNGNAVSDDVTVYALCVP